MACRNAGHFYFRLSNFCQTDVRPQPPQKIRHLVGNLAFILLQHASPISLNATITGLKFFFESTLDRLELMRHVDAG